MQITISIIYLLVSNMIQYEVSSFIKIHLRFFIFKLHLNVKHSHFFTKRQGLKKKTLYRKKEEMIPIKKSIKSHIF